MFTEEIEPEDYVYYVSRKKNRESIKVFGLIPQVGKAYEGQAKKYRDETNDTIPAVFVNNSKDFYGKGMFDWDIWRINTRVLKNKWVIDNHMRVKDKHKYLVTFEEIPRHAIELIYEGKH